MLDYLKASVPELWKQKVVLETEESLTTWKHSVSAYDSYPEELKARIVQCWEEFPKVTIIKVIDLFNRCLCKCIEAGGQVFEHLM